MLGPLMCCCRMVGGQRQKVGTLPASLRCPQLRGLGKQARAVMTALAVT